MTENLNQDSGFFDIQVESSEYTVAPGSSIDLPLSIKNQSLETDSFRLTVDGIPPGWVATSSPVTLLDAGEEKRISIIIHPPPAPQTSVGHYPFLIKVTSQQYPERSERVDMTLHVAAFEVQGRIGVLIDSTNYSVAPGSSTTVNLLLHTQGVTEDEFRISVVGIPANWISTPSALTQIAPGEEKEVELTIRPPRTPQSRAGRQRFEIQISSQAVPDQSVEVKCTLTIAAYTHFASELDPEEIAADEEGLVTVKNLSNIQQSYSLTWESEEDSLQFEPAEPVQMRAQPGETALWEYNARPRSRPLFGAEYTYPFTANVQSAEQKVQILRGDLKTNALIPFLIIPVVFVLCMAVLCIAMFFYYFRSQSTIGNATQTAAYQETSVALIAAATQTAAAQQSATPTVLVTITITPGDVDTDGDGLPDNYEIEIGTDPNNPDTDADDLNDGEEVLKQATDPLNPDTDSDELKDGEEVLRQKTNPHVPDTDGDGLSDGKEVIEHNTDPLKPDSDDDGLKDGDEIQRGTDPNNSDTDADELKDGEEVAINTNPLNPDTDNDRMTDGVEVQRAAGRGCPNPLDPDSDKDSIIDGLDLDPCDPNNPSLTATAAAGMPTNTPVPPTQAPPTQPPPTDVPTAGPTVIPPPDNLQGKIAFESNRDGNSEIYLYDTNDGSILRLTNDNAVDTQPALSPDLNWIAFVSNRTGNNEIFVMRTDGSGLTNITNDGNDDQSPAWSPNSNNIAFQSNREGNYEIYAMDRDGGGLHNLSNTPTADDVQPNWFEGKLLIFTTNNSIAFTSNRDGDQEIYLMDADGGNQTNLTNSHPGNDSQPYAAPAGDLIAFTSDRDNNLEIYIMNVDGSGQINLTKNPAQDQMATWSADNRYIAFTTDRDGSNEIYTMERDGSNPYNLTRNPAQDIYPSWQ